MPARGAHQRRNRRRKIAKWDRPITVSKSYLRPPYSFDRDSIDQLLEQTRYHMWLWSRRTLHDGRRWDDDDGVTMVILDSCAGMEDA